MILGPLALVVAALAMSRHSALSLSWLDAVYPVLLAATLAARRVDSASFAGLTADGETATAAEIQTWSLKVSAFAVAGWLAGHLLARFLS